MIRFTPAVEVTTWGVSSTLAAVTSGAEGLGALIELYGPWGIIAAGAFVLFRLVIKDMRSDQKKILDNQQRIWNRLKHPEDSEDEDL